MNGILATRKAKLYAAAIAGALGLALFGQPKDDSQAIATPIPSRDRTRAAPATITPNAAALLTRLAHRTADSKTSAELFAAHSWYVAPPPPPPPPPPGPPPPPTAPPLPFAYLGSYTAQGDKATYFVARGDRIYDIKVGDSLDADYSLDSVEGSDLIFNYKPLKQRQSLPAGGLP